MVSANQEMVVYCFDALVAHYNSDQVPPPDFEEGLHPLFVTWKKAVNGSEPRLRGCIGTLEARALINGFKDYALTSALRDMRFPPIQPKELPHLECTVSILTNYESALHYLDWEKTMATFSRRNTSGRLLDKYLGEISPDQSLKVSKFLTLAESLPGSARDNFELLISPGQVFGGDTIQCTTFSTGDDDDTAAGVPVKSD